MFWKTVNNGVVVVVVIVVVVVVIVVSFKICTAFTFSGLHHLFVCGGQTHSGTKIYESQNFA